MINIIPRLFATKPRLQKRDTWSQHCTANKLRRLAEQRRAEDQRFYQQNRRVGGFW
jgi:hypothetical protein